jgi:hypothetical protein
MIQDMRKDDAAKRGVDFPRNGAGNRETRNSTLSEEVEWEREIEIAGRRDCGHNCKLCSTHW